MGYEKPIALVCETELSADEAYSAAAAPAIKPVATVGAAVGAAAFTKYCW